MEQPDHRLFMDIDVDLALDEISKKDPVMKDLVGTLGPCELEPGGNFFNSLVESMIYQQVTGRAAEAIYNRFVREAGGEVSPGSVGRMSPEQMRKAGISRQKVGYLTDLAEKVQSGKLRLDGMESLDDQEIIKQLTMVKGIGVWTAQMFLIFTLGRLDVLPLNDLGIRRAAQNRYGIRGGITDSKLEKIARKWRPYRTLGVLMLWKGENMKLPAP